MTRNQKNNIIEWVAALRSGRYCQTTRLMRRKIGRYIFYDVFGVACEIHPEISFDENRGLYLYQDIPFTVCFMPERVLNLLYGFTYDDAIMLIEISEKHKASFKYLADYLESYTI